MWKFIRFELRYWLKTPMVWIFFFINALFTFGATASDNVVIGGNASNIFKNAPFQIIQYYAIMPMLGLLMTTAFMNATANRDFQFGMYQFVFSSPIKKRDYFFGKFAGAAIVSLIPSLGLSFGALVAPYIAPLFPKLAPAERFGDVIWSAHVQGILTFAIPNVIIGGVLLYALAIIFRSNIVSFVGAMLLIVFYSVSATFTKDIQQEWLASLLDPFGLRPFDTVTKYLTVAEKNSALVVLRDGLLSNRLIWIGIGLLILFAVYLKFSFNTRKATHKKTKTDKQTKPAIVAAKVFHPSKAGVFSIGGLWQLVKFETKAIVKNPVFIIIMLIGLIILIVNLCNLTGYFGTERYPVTYLVVENIKDAYDIFLYGFIIFYTGMLVWKERDARINEIQDATPVRSSLLFTSKVMAMMVALTLVICGAIVLGIVAQTLYGYSRYDLPVYLESLIAIQLPKLFFMTILSLFLQYMINNRYIAWFAFISFIILDAFVWGLLDVSTNMVSFGSLPRITYSDMNGFGPFVPGTVWFIVYWTTFCVILCLVILLFFTRGKEEHIRHRFSNAKAVFSRRKTAISLSLITFALCGSFVFYNTKVLNTYVSGDEELQKSESYERKYSKYESLNQPRFFRLDYGIDIYPGNRVLKTRVEAWARNISGKPIPELHFTIPSDSMRVSVPDAKLKVNDRKLSYQIYKLDKPLSPGDSIKITVTLSETSKGFENEVSFTDLTQNGTFFNNRDIMPTFGYNRDYEIQDKNERVQRNLPKRKRMPQLDDSNLAARSNTYIGNDSDWVNVNTVISTSGDQIAVAPGSLVKQWEKDGRNYFNYKLDHKALNFYSFISARYEVARRKWNGIDLEVYYDKDHAYNVKNMLDAMQKSLEYYTKNFGPYYQKQCRIIEFPRYSSFAQAFPGTMPYSEEIGFITDLRDVKESDIDMVFYIVAHEMGHQYWAHQLCGANMQGSEMMSEGFSQYSALMVMEKEYGKDKMQKFLKYEMDDYLSGRSYESEAERPLMRTESQQYIHYNKASVVMYYLKEMIGEDKTNLALRQLLTQFAYKEPPYATSNYAVREFRKVTPDSLQYLIDDMFENITLFDNRMVGATYAKKGKDYVVTLRTRSEKSRSDSLGNETKTPIKDYVDVAVFAAPKGDAKIGKALAKRRFKITKKENTFTFRVNEQPYNAGIDPYNYLIDRVPDDNLKAFE